jgi:hypothetical protein
VIHDRSAHDHRRRSAAIEVERMTQTEAPCELLQLVEAHAEADQGVPPVDGDQPDALLLIGADHCPWVALGVEPLPQPLGREIAHRLAVAHQQPGAPNHVGGGGPYRGRRAEGGLERLDDGDPGAPREKRKRRCRVARSG